MTQHLNIKILVLGGKCVGKSAITVRFLTKRYIGEYKSNIDWLYQQTVKIDDGIINIELLDISRCWQDENNKQEIKDQIEWAEAFVVIYSICDRHSFNRAQEFLKAIISLRAPVYLPIILLANKRDLEVGRQVYLNEGRSLALQFGCQFYEISAADSNIGVSSAFDGLIREARALHSRSHTQNSQRNSHRKLSIITVSRVFSAMFGKSHSHSSSDDNNNNNNGAFNGHKNSSNSSNKRKNTVMMIPVIRKANNKPTISL